jgi:uncharacterized protein with PIN domain
MPSRVQLRFDEALGLFVPRAVAGVVEVEHDGTSTVGHLVQSVGIPLTEVGALFVAGRLIEPAYRDLGGQVVDVRAPDRPQRSSGWPRFVLDVHLGALARRLRLLGVDTAYRSTASDDELVDRAYAEFRVLLTRDRGILRRRAAWGHAAYVRGDRVDDQVGDVLDRFEPPLEPYSRCLACNTGLAPVAKSEVVHLLRPGTTRSYDEFWQCVGCRRVYWRGAHSGRLDAAVAAGLGRRRPSTSPTLGDCDDRADFRHPR